MDEDEMNDELEDYKNQFDEDLTDGSFRLRKAPRSLLSRGSVAIREQVQDPKTGDWRTVVRFSRRKFDNDWAKQVFLETYQKWGRIGEAAAAAGVSTQTVRKACEDDEEFAEAVMMAEEAYREKLIAHHQDLVFNGTEKISYDRNGNVVSKEQIFPIRLIELELKKHDKGYREKQEIDITHKGGVLVAPAEMDSIDDWEKRFQKAKLISPSGEEEED
jgi:hypothetical protein